MDHNLGLCQLVPKKTASEHLGRASRRLGCHGQDGFFGRGLGGGGIGVGVGDMRVFLEPWGLHDET